MESSYTYFEPKIGPITIVHKLNSRNIKLELQKLSKRRPSVGAVEVEAPELVVAAPAERLPAAPAEREAGVQRQERAEPDVGLGGAGDEEVEEEDLGC